MRKAEKKRQAFAHSLTTEYIRKITEEVDELRADVDYLDFKVEELERRHAQQDECLCEPEPGEKSKHNWVKLGEFLDIFTDMAMPVRIISDEGYGDFTLGTVPSCYKYASVINADALYQLKGGEHKVWLYVEVVL